jgi:hypothetical protein
MILCHSRYSGKIEAVSLDFLMEADERDKHVCSSLKLFGELCCRFSISSTYDHNGADYSYLSSKRTKLIELVALDQYPRKWIATLPTRIVTT